MQVLNAGYPAFSKTSVGGRVTMIRDERETSFGLLEYVGTALRDGDSENVQL